MRLVSLAVMAWVASGAPPPSPPAGAKPVASLDSFALRRLPEGLTLESAPEIYGTPEHKAESGTIFDYIDGGGEVYLHHGLRKVLHLRLQDAQKRVLTADVYDMATARNAAAALADEAICAPGAETVDVGVPAKVHHYPPEYLLYLVKERYLVYLSASDELAGVVRAFARQIAAEIR